MVERPLRDVVVVRVLIAHQSGLQFSRTGKPGLFDHFTDAPVEALYHPIGLWVPRWCQAVLDALDFALQVKRVLAAGLFTFAGESVRKLAAVVGQ